MIFPGGLTKNAEGPDVYQVFLRRRHAILRITVRPESYKLLDE